MSSTSEPELVRRGRAGSAAAFELLVRRHEAPAQAAARAICYGTAVVLEDG